MGKFLNLIDILTIIETEKEKGKTIVTTNGCFDILHVGHLDYLTEAGKKGDILVVGINTDYSVQKIKGPTRPINKETDRARLVAALDCVDYTFLFDEDTPIRFLKLIKPHIHVKGNDYNAENLPEANTVVNLGAQLAFVPLTKGKSTTDLISRILTNK